MSAGGSPATNGAELTTATINEPNNTEVQTTALFNNQTHLGYLGVYDLDFFSVYGLSQAEAVSFSPSAGTYAAEQSVSITNGLGGTLRYTTNETDPTEASPLYAAAIPVDRNLTVKARAFGSALPNLVFSAEYILKPETPAISLAGGTYADIQTTTISCGTADVAIRYTTNGIAPTATTGELYSIPLSIDRSMTLKAAAFRNGWTPSEVTSRVYTLKVATPAVSSSGSGWAITCATPGATIRYSTDLNEPTTSSAIYTPGSVVGGSSTVIKARAWKGSMDASAIGASSAPPVPAFTANQASVNNPSSFDAATTTDDDSTAAEIQVRWDWTNDGTWDTDFSVTKTAQYSYSAVGTYTIRLEAKDKWGVTAQATKAVTIVSYYLSNFELISIPAGSFNNGTGMVTLSAFKMSKYETTQAQYQAVMGSNPSFFPSGTDAPNRPVEQTNWYDALVFCNKLSILEGFTPVYSINGSTNPTSWGTAPNSQNATWDAATMNRSASGYRLPTEAEWEYAARGGNPVESFTYAGNDTIGNVAWHDSNSGFTTHPVGRKAANKLGLKDMSGNVWEWCWDWYGSYPSGAQTDPGGAASGTYRVLRGGCWADDGDGGCTVSRRHYVNPGIRYGSVGFRLVRP